jgi:glycosyltransferase involved in cell wall biosynthesis
VIKENFISIITVVYNSELLIRKTIESVICQNEFYKIQYIIIDGNSTDNTKNIINEYTSYISEFVSEKDFGIYDAMNKGMQYVRGDWVLFLNAGDELADFDVINNISKNISNKDEILYGNIIIESNSSLRKIVPSKLFYLNFKMIFCHQAVFVKHSLLQSTLHPFDLDFKLAADFNQFYNFFREGKIFRYINIDVCKYDLTGQSILNPLKYQKEVISIINKQNKNYFRKIFFIFLFFLINFKTFIKIMLDIFK